MLIMKRHMIRWIMIFGIHDVKVGVLSKVGGLMKTCAFRGSMLIPMNGSSMEELNVQRGSKQGDC